MVVLWLLAYPFADTWFSTDEGIYAYQAQRIVEGQVVYRDFVQLSTPGYLFMLAGWMKLVGMSVVSLRLFMLLVMLATAIAIYAACRRLGVTPLFSFIPSLAFSVLKSRSHFELNHYPPNVLFEIAALALLAGYMMTRRRWTLAGAGALVGADILTTQHLGTHMLTGALLTILLDYLLNRNSLLRNLFSFALGFVPLPAFYLLYATATGSLSAAYRCVFIWVFGTYTKFDPQDYWFHWIRVTLDAFVSGPGIRTAYDLSLALFESLVAPLAVIAATVYLRRVRSRDGRLAAEDNALGATALIAASMYAAIYAAPNSLIPRVSMIGYLLCYVLGFRVYREWRGRTSSLSLSSLVSLSGAVSILFVFALPIRTAMVARNILQQHATVETRSVRTARGLMRVPVSSDRGQIAVLDYMSKNIPAGAPVFAANWSPWIYYLGGYRNPTRLDYLLPLFTDQNEVGEAIRRLEAENVEWIVQDSILRRNLERRDGRFQALDSSAFETWAFFGYVRESFDETAKIGDYVIYRRRGAAPPTASR